MKEILKMERQKGVIKYIMIMDNFNMKKIIQIIKLMERRLVIIPMEN